MPTQPQQSILESREHHAYSIENGFTRPVSRADSVTTTWSSAEVPLFLDSGFASSSDSTMDLQAHLSGFSRFGEDERSIERVTTPPLPRSPLVTNYADPSDYSPPWLSKLSPPKTSPFKQKRRPPALQLQASSSTSLHRATSSTSITSPVEDFNGPQGGDLSSAIERNLKVEASQRQEMTHPDLPEALYSRSPVNLLFDPNYCMGQPPCERPHQHAMTSYEGPRLHPAVREQSSSRTPSDEYSPARVPYADSVQSSESSSHATDSIGIRTPEHPCAPLSLASTMNSKEVPVYASLPPFRSHCDLRNASIGPDIDHLRVQTLTLRTRNSSLTKSQSRIRPSTTEARAQKSPRLSTPRVEDRERLPKAYAPSDDKLMSMVRTRSRTLGSLERPHTTGLLFTSPAGHVKSAGQQRSVDLTDVRRNSALDAGTTYTIDGASMMAAQISPTQLSFSTESGYAEPRTPRTPRSALRPKSQGGWAAYLSKGLQLRIEQEGGSCSTITMQYMSYDPFGRSESLAPVEDASRPPTPRRPKSRSSKDDSEEAVGILHFAPAVDAKQLSFLASSTSACPILRHLSVADDHRADLLTRQAALTVVNSGAHEASGSERKGRLAWRFLYEVQDFSDGNSNADARYKLIKPVSFACSATLLDPDRARKSRLLKLVKKQIGSQIVATPVSIPSCQGSIHDESVSALSSPQRSDTPLQNSYLPHAAPASRPSSPRHESSLLTSEGRERQPTDARPTTPGGLVPFKMARSKVSKASLRQSAKLQAEQAAAAAAPAVPALPALPAGLAEHRAAVAPNSNLGRPALSRPRSNTNGATTARPATASELIKWEYLDRQEASRAGVLHPDTFANVDVRARRRRLRTAEGTVHAEDGCQVHQSYPPLTPPRKTRPRMSQTGGEEYPPQTCLVGFSPSRQL
ncbi:hypothetical protein K437DRAFT_268368 [Tilletiaria anomala UBC 951]|uniref:Uncharacterized protein n=1 Tax=Tilletiaria anomala (strain ATCC 24038 / CBS 436.72 / UBC 951) TaxID=1037660 RepID=A0A066W3B7_TILAU|nr:uncharacterized protein K437DRAFT_268368 [Tilletiaria anomala UBC 951]KDN45584.1 hypothetical protein K437DRAFT_268368 [Tilletiaria anomala UBC 951]